MTWWIRQFKDVDRSCEDEVRSRKSLSDAPDGIRQHLDKFLSVSAKASAKHFRTSVPLINRILQTHLGFQMVSRRRVPHERTDDQKWLMSEMSEELLTVPRNDESAWFSHVAPGNESQFSYRHQSIHYYAKSCVEVPANPKTRIATKGALVTLCFAGTKLVVLDVIPSEQKFN
jgi:hypothetical protein